MPHFHNSAPKGLTSTDFKGHDWQDKAMKRLPKPIRDFVMFECVADVNLVSILKHVKKVGAEQALADIHTLHARLAKLAYGEDYPI